MSLESPDVVVTMTAILSTMFAVLAGLVYIQQPSSSTKSSFYPDPITEPSKFSYEMYHSFYSPIWMFIFGIIVVFQLYEEWSAREYNLYLFILALPCVLQPVLFPSGFSNSPDSKRPIMERYSTKANIWLATYTFIGNYWYTHYFYSVLKAKYTMPSTRLNNVPIAMFFATMFYFSSYHVFSNCMLRKIKTSFAPTIQRRVLYIMAVCVLSYFTAFMETLTISSFPYYSFEDRNMAYTVGSAFYGIYFLVSFPAFLEFDGDVDNKSVNARKVSSWNAFVESCGYGMMIMCLLDFVRLYLDIPLIVGA